MRDRVILAISLAHDSGAALFVDGKLVGAVAEERLNRIKLTREFPSRSIEQLLGEEGLSFGDVGRVLLSSRITPNWLSLRFSKFHNRESENVFSYLRKEVIREQSWFRKTGLIHIESWFVKNIIANRLRELGCNKPVTQIDHHLCHSYSAYSAAPFDNSLVVSIDAMGDGLCCLVSLGGGGRLRSIREMDGFSSPASIYAQITQLMGFIAARHEGKVTGLAALGNPGKCAYLFKKLMSYQKDRFLVKNITSPNHSIYKEIMKYSREDVAAALQQVLEDILVEFIKDLIKETGREKIALAGGLFANVKLNQRIHEIDGVKEIFIFPNMGDGGLPVGAGYCFLRKKPEGLNNIYLGKAYDNKYIHQLLKKNRFKYKFYEDIEKRTAQCLAEEKVVARFSGRMEYGPRSLGNRSILYQTCDVSVNDWLNKKLSRTEFMPFAPSTMAEYADEYYEGTDGAKNTSKFMNITFACTEKSKNEQPACVHVDGSARPQLVRKEDNPSYYRVLKNYHFLTGLPTILNTSFNVHEEPIVACPEDAIRAFENCGLDYLVLENFLVERDL